MNMHTPPLSPAPSPKSHPRRADQEFLPAALELLETPASPVGVALIWIICLLACGALGWSYFGRIDIVAIAQGKLQPTGRVKVIQPVDPGRIVALHVENGQRVAKGQVLVELDPDEARADVTALSSTFASFRAEALRRKAALAAVSDRALLPVPAIAWDAAASLAIPPAIREREERVLSGDLSQLAAVLAGLAAQQAQKRLELTRLTGLVEAQGQLVATLKERVDMRSSLAGVGAGSKAVVIDALETMQYHRTQLVTTQGQIGESQASLQVIALEIEKAYDAFAAENGQKLAEAERQADDVEQRLAKAVLKAERSRLASPIDGVVSSLSITTIGQVVGVGEEVMRVVPGGLGLEIEAYMPNRDIGFVKAGQDAVVKVESLPFTRYGVLNATVLRVGSDAVPQPDADQTEGNPAKSARNTGFAGAQRTQNLVFPVTLRPTTAAITADGVDIPLSPGMAVTVEVKTGSRRILEYLFSPLVEVAQRAMKER